VKKINGVLSKSDDTMEANNSDLNSEENIDRGSICINENEVSSYSSVIITADIEGIKLDMSILEARLLNATKECKSDISSLQMKLKELKGVIRHQRDVICKLSEDNLILKSKLSSIENLTPKVIYYDHMNNEHVNESVSIIHDQCTINDQCTSHVIDQSTNLNSSNLSFIENLTNKDSSLLNNIQVPVSRENLMNNEHVNKSASVIHVNEACFKRRASHVPNALKIIDNQMNCLIIYCF
jgi:hypothetical protein